MKKIPIYPRKDYAIKAAREFIIKSQIRSLPVDLFKIYKKYGWVIKSISEIKALTKKHNQFKINYELNCDAKTYLTSKGRYLTIYDGAIYADGRILWTIAHEIGHIVLRHMEDFEQTEVHKGLTEAENKALETEANIFASEFLAPAEVLLHCKCTKKNSILRLCRLSKEAAENKEDYLLKYRSKVVHDSVNKLIFRQFYDYITSKIYYHKVHINMCPNCKNYILSTRERFCRICGKPVVPWTLNNTLNRGIIYNDGIETDKTGTAIICPKCLSDNIAVNDNMYICSKCGTML